MVTLPGSQPLHTIWHIESTHDRTKLALTAVHASLWVSLNSNSISAHLLSPIYFYRLLQDLMGMEPNTTELTKGTGRRECDRFYSVGPLGGKGHTQQHKWTLYVFRIGMLMGWAGVTALHYTCCHDVAGKADCPCAWSCTC